MKSANESTQAFIVRIWLEPREQKDAQPLWRGVIEHIDDRKSVYFIDLDQAVAYFASVIEAMGGKLSKVCSVRTPDHK